MVRIGVSLKESEAQITAMINRQLAKKLNSTIKQAAPLIESQIKHLVRGAITGSPEYRELLGGSLQAEMGVPNTQSRLQQILSIFLDSIGVEAGAVSISGSRIRGSVTVFGIPTDFSDVLSSSAATYTTAKGQTIPWLEWLLLAGDKIIISDYEFSSDISPGAKSRTGLGIMKKDTRKRWRVPPQFAGFAEDNFVTRSLESVKPQIEKIIKTNVERAYSGS